MQSIFEVAMFFVFLVLAAGHAGKGLFEHVVVIVVVLLSLQIERELELLHNCFL